MEHFSTERLIARDWTVADAEGAFASYGRGEVARWLGGPPRRPGAGCPGRRAQRSLGLPASRLASAGGRGP
jgi:hypothetical protein